MTSRSGLATGEWRYAVMADVNKMAGWQNGTVDMIVMNGADGTTGPIQLITFDH